MVKGSDILIWFFLAGMIAGAVGVILILAWWIKTHAIKVTPEQMMKDIEAMKEDEAHD